MSDVDPLERVRYIEGFEGIYSVNVEGEVHSHRYSPPRKLKGGRDGKGYSQVCLTKGRLPNKIQKTFKVHRLVAKYFVKNPDPEIYTQVNHINECTSDARACNLEWVTGQENITYSQACSYKLTHKDGTVFTTDNINDFCRDILKVNGASNFLKLLKGSIKSCYGFIGIERLDKTVKEGVRIND